MKTLDRLSFPCRLLLACFVFGGAVSARGAETDKPASGEFVAPKSVFVDDIKIGKDPFFPNSDRRKPKAVEAPKVPTPTPAAGGPTVPTPPPDPPPKVDPFKHLILKGVTGNQRFALINNQTFAVGESFNMRTPDGAIRVKCEEIRERSVIVTIDGSPERKELQLRPGL